MSFTIFYLLDFPFQWLQGRRINDWDSDDLRRPSIDYEWIDENVEDDDNGSAADSVHSAGPFFDDPAELMDTSPPSNVSQSGTGHSPLPSSGVSCKPLSGSASVLSLGDRESSRERLRQSPVGSQVAMDIDTDSAGENEPLATASKEWSTPTKKIPPFKAYAKSTSYHSSSESSHTSRAPSVASIALSPASDSMEIDEDLSKRQAIHEYNEISPIGRESGSRKSTKVNASDESRSSGASSREHTPDLAVQSSSKLSLEDKSVTLLQSHLAEMPVTGSQSDVGSSASVSARESGQVISPKISLGATDETLSQKSSNRTQRDGSDSTQTETESSDHESGSGGWSTDSTRESTPEIMPENQRQVNLEAQHQPSGTETAHESGSSSGTWNDSREPSPETAPSSSSRQFTPEIEPENQQQVTLESEHQPSGIEKAPESGSSSGTSNDSRESSPEAASQAQPFIQKQPSVRDVLQQKMSDHLYGANNKSSNVPSHETTSREPSFEKLTPVSQSQQWQRQSTDNSATSDSDSEASIDLTNVSKSSSASLSASLQASLSERLSKLLYDANNESSNVSLQQSTSHEPSAGNMMSVGQSTEDDAEDSSNGSSQ